MVRDSWFVVRGFFVCFVLSLIGIGNTSSKNETTKHTKHTKKTTNHEPRTTNHELQPSNHAAEPDRIVGHHIVVKKDVRQGVFGE